MPELPEVETIRLQLNQVLKGLKIKEIEVLKAKSFQGDKRDVIDKTVVGVERRGKMILIKLTGGVCLAIHLKLTGQLIYRVPAKGGSASGGNQVDQVNRVPAEGWSAFGGNQVDGPFAVRELPNKYTRVIITFNNGAKLFFNDLRIFGWVKVIANCELSNCEFEKLGPEANDEKAFTFEYFKNILSRSKKPIKLVIMDQEKLAGIGNIYANEALFMAGIDPRRPANSLRDTGIAILRDSVLKVLKEAIKHKGTSDKDEAFRQISGEKGSFQNYLQVYGRAGQKCPKCSGEIKRIKLGGRGTFYCSHCQK